MVSLVRRARPGQESAVPGSEPQVPTWNRRRDPGVGTSQPAHRGMIKKFPHGIDAVFDAPDGPLLAVPPGSARREAPAGHTPASVSGADSQERCISYPGLYLFHGTP